MIAELGLASLWLAAGLCMLQFIAGAIGARSEEQGPVAALVRPAAIVQAVLLVISLGCLLWVFAGTQCGADKLLRRRSGLGCPGDQPFRRPLASLAMGFGHVRGDGGVPSLLV
mgnify:CR=1 FL=1